jgi:hypothetical protein
MTSANEVKDMSTMMDDYIANMRESFKRAPREEEPYYKERLQATALRLIAQHDLYVLQAQAIEPLVKELKAMLDG